MKRKIVRICLLLLLCLFCIGCKKDRQERETEFSVFYLDRTESYINGMPYEPVGAKVEKEELIQELLEQLSTQTNEIDYQPVISSFSIKNCFVRGGQITLNFSEEYAQLAPTKEVLVRAAIVKTLTQVEGIELVAMQVNGKPLQDTLEKQ